MSINRFFGVKTKKGVFVALLICLIGACAILAVCLFALQHEKSPTFETKEALLENKVTTPDAEIKSLNLADSLCYAVYSSSDGSLFFLHIQKTEQGYLLLKQTEKLGFPVGINAVPEISGSVDFDFGHIVFLLQKADYYSNSSYGKFTNGNTILFSNVTLFVTQE